MCYRKRANSICIDLFCIPALGSERPGVIRDPGRAEGEGGPAEGRTRGLQESDERRKCRQRDPGADETFPPISAALTHTYKTDFV